MAGSNVQILAEKVAQVILTGASGMSRQYTYRGADKDTGTQFEIKLARFIQKLEDRESDKAYNELQQIVALKEVKEKESKKENSKKEKEKDKPKEQDSGLKEFIKKLTAILAPAAILASIIGSETGGMRVFLGAVKVLGNVIGATFAPVMFMGAAAVLSLADMLSDWLLPNLDKWYEWLVTTGFELFRWLEDEITKSVTGAVDKLNLLTTIVGLAGEAIKEWKDKIDPKKGKTAGILDNLSGGPVREWLGGMLGINSVNDSKTEQLGQAIDDLATGGGNKTTINSNFSDKIWNMLGMKTDKNGRPVLNPAGGFGGRMQGNMKDVLQEFRMQNAPQAQRMSIADAAKNAQLAALQMSPYESRMLKLVEKVADSMDKAVAKLPPPPTSE